MTLADGQKLGDRSLWKDRVPPSADVFIEGFELFDGFTAIEERSGGVKRLRTLAANGKSDFVASDEPAYAMALGKNAEPRSEEHTSELQSLMRISYAVFCLKKTKETKHNKTHE